jgi:phosphoesterase RecJ-like protein
MFTHVMTEQDALRLKSHIEENQRFLVVAHVSPDGDAMGSTLALAHFLQGLGKEVTVVMPNSYPDFLAWLPGAHDVVLHDRETERVNGVIERAEVLFCLDFNDFSRVAQMEQKLSGRKIPKILIDHHLDPSHDFDITVSHPDKSSTCELLFLVLAQLGYCDALAEEECTCLYTGMMTDTGGFTYNSNRSEIFMIIAELLKRGIDKDKIYRNVFYNYSEQRFRLMGYILYTKMKYMPQYHASLLTLTRQEQKLFSHVKGDTEGFVNIPLQIKGAKLSISLREDTEKPGCIRVSLRSVDDFPCNKMAAEFFNGGGHLNASGGELRCSMEEAEEIVSKALARYAPLLA